MSLYVQDDDEMIAAFNDDPEVQAVLNAVALEGLEAAKAVARGITRSGDYLASLDVQGTVLATSDPAGHIIEWGSVNSPPRGVLRKAVEQTGATWVDEGPG